MSRRSSKRKSKSPQMKAAENRREWTRKEIKLLGKMSDRQAAKKLGRTMYSVRGKRLNLGIERSYGDHYRPWSRKQLALLGKYPDKEVARMLGKNYATVVSRRRAHKIPNRHLLIRPWTKQEIAILHRVKSHGEVARLTKRTMEAVSQKRDRLNRERKRRRQKRAA